MQKCYKITFNFVDQKQPKYFLSNFFLAHHTRFLFCMMSFIYKCMVSLLTNLLYLNFIILPVSDLHWLFSSIKGKPDHTSWVLIVSRLGQCFSGCHLKACGDSSLWSLLQLQILCPDRLLIMKWGPIAISSPWFSHMQKFAKDLASACVDDQTAACPVLGHRQSNYYKWKK